MKSRRKTGILGLITLLVFTIAIMMAFTGCDNTTEEQGAVEPLQIVISESSPPFSMFTDTGELVGYDYDVACELGERLGVPYEVSPVVFDGVIAGLTSGKYDIVVAGMSKTPEREEVLAFSKPYYVSGGILVAVQDKALSSVNDYKDLKVGVQVGSTYEDFAVKSGLFSNLVPYKVEQTMMDDIKVGRLDALVSDQVMTSYAVQQNDYPFVFVGDLLFEEECCITTVKGNQELMDDINVILTAMESDGTLETLRANWLGQ